MGITYGDHLIDSGYYDIMPEQEREIWAREECARRGIDPDELCADGGVEAWTIVAQEIVRCPSCKGSGEIGWFDFAEGAWRNEPCTECGPAAPKVEG